MYYWGYFRSSDTTKDSDGQLYKVVIITDFNNKGYLKEGSELTLTSTPFTVNYTGEDDNLFKPYKCSTATISFYQSKINKDFNSLRGNDILVTLFKLKDGVTPTEVDFTVLDESTNPSLNDYSEYTVEWIGFATPNAFNQSYNSDFNVFEMEAQDALSTLQYYDYKPCYNDVVGTESLQAVLLNILRKLGIYKTIYISSNISSPSSDDEILDITNYILMNERNLYNEDGEAKKMLEVLSDIMQYLCLTAIAYGDSLYILDYTALGKDYNSYYKIISNITIRRGSFIVTIEDNLPWIREERFSGRNFGFADKGLVTLKDFKEIKPNLIADDNINFSLGSTYNKVKVTDDYYFTNGFDLFDKLVYSKTPSEIKQWNWSKENKSDSIEDNFIIEESTEYYTKIRKASTGEKVYLSFCGKDNSINSDIDIKTYWWEDKYHNELAESGTYRNYFWDSSTLLDDSINANRAWNFEHLVKYAGCVMVKECINKNSITKSDLKPAFYFPTGMKYNTTPNDVIKEFGDDAKAKEEIVVEFVIKNQHLNKGDYLILNGNFFFYERWLPLAYTNPLDALEGDKYIYARCEVNGKYWRGSSFGSDLYTFKLPLDTTGINTGYNVAIPIKQTKGLDDGLVKAGYAIKLPVDHTLQTDIKISLCKPRGIGQNKHSELIVLRDFSLDIVSTSSIKELFNENTSTNTIYENVIDEGALEEYNEITLPLTTYNGKDRDYSSLYVCASYLSDNTNPIMRLARLYNTAHCRINTAEEHIINNIANQYSTPNTILDVSLYNSGNYKPYSTLTYNHFKDALFVVDGMSIDYANNINTLHLVEVCKYHAIYSQQKRSRKRDYQRNGDIINNAQVAKKDSINLASYQTVGLSANIYRDEDVIKIDKINDNPIWAANPLELGGEIPTECYTRFDINEKGELVIYCPNSLYMPTANINDSNELIFTPKRDNIIIK